MKGCWIHDVTTCNMHMTPIADQGAAVVKQARGFGAVEANGRTWTNLLASLLGPYEKGRPCCSVVGERRQCLAAEVVNLNLLWHIEVYHN